MKKAITYICAGICLGLILLLALLPTIVTVIKGIPQPAYGKPTEVTEKIEGLVNVDQILHDNNHIYLLDAYEGYLRIFDTDGNYLSGFSFFDMQHGIFQMALEEDVLYVRDPKRGLYFFKGGAFEWVSEGERKNMLIESLNFYTNSDCYKVVKGDIWKYSDGVEYKVIDIPWYSFLAHPTTGGILMILYMLLMMGLRLPGIIKKNKEKLPLEA